MKFLTEDEAAEHNAQEAFERAEMDRDDDMANWADDYDRAWSRR